MPEFILDMGSSDDARTFKALDAFTQGYIEAMFFTETGTGDDEELENVTFADLSADSLAKIIEECRGFVAVNGEDLEEACDNGRINGYDMASAGRDFWFSRNGHGVGYWDRDLGDVGDDLHDNAASYGEAYIYMGDDGMVHYG